MLSPKQHFFWPQAFGIQETEKCGGNRLIILYVLNALLLALLTACQAAPAQPATPSIASIRVVMDNNYPPYAFPDEQGKLQGILVDQWMLWEQRTGVKVEIIGRPWEKALEGMKNGEYDVIDTIFYTNERAKIFDFTKPYATIDVRIFFPNNISGITNTASLKGFRIAVKSGDADAEYLLSQGVTDLTYYDNYEDIIQAVSKKEETIFVADQPPTLYYLYKYGLQNDYNYSEPLYSGEFHRAVKKGNIALLNLVNAGFAQISEAEYQRIDSHWFGTYQVNGLNRIIPYLGIGTVLAVLAIFGLGTFNRTLQTRVKVRTQELEQALTGLQASETHFRESIEFLPIPISIANSQGNILTVNHQFVDLYGYTVTDIPTISAWMRCAYPNPTYREKVIAQWQKDTETVTHNHTTTPPREYEVTGKDGQVHIVEITMRVVGNLWVAAFIEITERKRSEEALHQSEEKFAKAFKASPDGIILAEFETGRIVEVNEGFEKIYGFRRDEVLGYTSLELNLFADPADRKRFTDMLSKHGGVRDEEFRSRSKDGQEHLMQVSAELIEINGKLHLVSINHDITERKQAEKKLAQQFERLNSMRNIDHIIANSVDLSTNLALIIQEIIKQLHVDAAVILLFDTKTQTFNYTAGLGFHTNALQFTRLGPGDGLAGQAAQYWKIVHIPNLAELTEYPTFVKSLEVEGFVEYFRVPLIAKDQLLGVLEIFNRTPLDPDPDWMAFLETLTGQVSISIDSATLFNDLQISNIELELAYDATLEGWSRALDLRDRETEGHTRRVTEMAVRLARSMGLKKEEILQIKRGGLLHDIGKMGIPDAILLKPGELTEDEWEVMHRHPSYAYKMLSRIEYLKPALDIPYCHHEKWEGTGYPQGLKGQEIPLAARIFTVVDVWDALISDRPYRAAWPREKAIQYIANEAGRHFDPEIAVIFLELINRGEI